MLNTKRRIDEAYVVGCGQSLAGFDWQLLRDKTTIAINGAVVEVPNLDFFVTADSKFACRASRERFWNTRAHKVLVMGSDHRGFKSVEPFLLDWDSHVVPTRFNGDVGFVEADFCTGQNSGFCGMQLAVLLGAKRVHLLGIDLCGKGGFQNYHGRYRSMPNAWDEFLVHFKKAIPVLQEHGVEVVNHSKTSRLNLILPYEEFV